jgi:hypothetical protein
MPITSAGVIRLSDIQNEFGGTNPINISEYYQNSTTNFTTGISGIPNIGSTFNMSVFYNKSKENVPTIPVPYSANIFARYTADGPFNKTGTTITQWYDLSGNNRHVTSNYFRGNVIQSTFTQGAKGLTGTSTLNTVRGNNTDGLYFPFALTQGSYTFAYIARYTGDKNNTTYNRRIFESRSGTGQTTIWGFNINISGATYVRNNYVSTTDTKQSETDWWMIGIDTEITSRFNGMEFTDNFIYMNNQYPRRPPAGYNPTPSINFGTNSGQNDSTQTSNWEVMELIFYNRELTTLEQIDVENYFANKYKHISFTAISPTFNAFKTHCSQQIQLYSLFNFIYNGYKWGYGMNAYGNDWYGPGIKRADFYVKNNRYLWIMLLYNGTLNIINRKYSNSGNRSAQNINYTIQMPNKDSNTEPTSYYYTIHCVMNGGGGGGSIKGGGAGGQIYFYNEISSLDNKIINLSIGCRGNSIALFDNNNDTSCSGGGDTTFSWVYNGTTYNFTAFGGYEGDTGTGGSYSATVPIIMEQQENYGGANGGNGGERNFSSVYPYFAGGMISIITDSINVYFNDAIYQGGNTTLWSIINDPSILNIFQYEDVGYPNFTNLYGAGGSGYRGIDQYYSTVANAKAGGGGFIVLIFDYLYYDPVTIGDGTGGQYTPP